MSPGNSFLIDAGIAVWAVLPIESPIDTLEIKIIPETEHHCRSALRWARRLDQSKAYDGFYVAAAEQTGSPLWTAYRLLANSALTAKVDWVHWVGDYETT